MSKIFLLGIIFLITIDVSAFYERPYPPPAPVKNYDGTVLFTPTGKPTDGWSYLISEEKRGYQGPYSYDLTAVPGAPSPFPMQSGDYEIYRVLAAPGTIGLAVSGTSGFWTPGKAAVFYEKRPIPCTQTITEDGLKCGGNADANAVATGEKYTFFNPQTLPSLGYSLNFPLYLNSAPLDVPTYYYFIIGASDAFECSVQIIASISDKTKFTKWQTDGMPLPAQVTTYNLTLNNLTPPNGKVDVTTCSIDGATCKLPYDKSPFKKNSEVTLTATPATGFEFKGWKGVTCKEESLNSNTCTVTMDADKTVSVSFEKPPIPPTKPKLQLGNNFGGVIREDETGLLKTQIASAQADTLPVVFSVIAFNPTTNSWVQKQKENFKEVKAFGFPARLLEISLNKWIGIDAAICPACTLKTGEIPNLPLKLVTIVGWADSKIADDSSVLGHFFEKSAVEQLIGNASISTTTEWTPVTFDASDLSFSNLKGFREITATLVAGKSEYYAFNIDDGIVFDDTNKDKSLLVFVGYQYIGSNESNADDFLFLSEPLILNAK